jgi:predicted RNase H-like HicB family nuclease
MKHPGRGNLTFVDKFGEPSEFKTSSSWEQCSPTAGIQIERGQPAEGWEDSAKQVLENLVKIVHARTQTELMLVALNARVKCLENALEDVRSRAAVVVPIQSLAPEPFELLKPIHALVQQSEEDFVASFLDANINASGETQEESLTNLKDLIVGSFEALQTVVGKLGPGPSKQLAVLMQFLKRSE